MMKYRIFLGLIFLECVILIFILSFSHTSEVTKDDALSAERSLAKKLMLTDLSVWTAARYTRHPSQTDIFSPFQDFPGAIEHFPAGSIIAPPEGIKGDGMLEFK